MTGPTTPKPSSDGGAGESARLDELAAVTRQYATYSRTRFGLAYAWTGVWLIAFAVLDLAGRHWPAQIGYVLGPLMSLLANGRARSWYQRHGAVVEGEPDARSAYLPLACIWLVLNALTLAWDARWWVRANGALGVVACGVGVVGSLAAAILAPRLIRGTRESAVLLGLAMLRLPTGPRWFEDAVSNLARAGCVALYAVIVIWVGVRQHQTYRALERRLAALKAHA